MEYKSNNNVVYSCKYHVVWCPKYRRKVLVGDVEARLKELVVQICKDIRVDLLEMEVMPDHVHLLLEVDPQFGIHKAVKAIKGRTSRVLRSEFQALNDKDSYTLDKQLLCFNSRWSSACCHKTIYRKSEDIAKGEIVCRRDIRLGCIRLQSSRTS